MSEIRHRAERLTAPEADALLSRAQRWPAGNDERTKAAFHELFHKLQAIAVCGDDERQELWLTAPRGTIEDFGNYEEYLESEDVESREEFDELWRSEYPEPLKWYRLATMVYQETHAVFVDGNLVFQLQPEVPEQYPTDKSALAGWLLSTVDETLELLREGDYNEFVRQNLPYRKRLGKILREDYWRIFPDVKDEHLKGITSVEIFRLETLIHAQPTDSATSRLPEMTSGIFFDCCRQGYEANHYPGIDGLTPIEMYRAFADGRDDGLTALDEASVEAFASWYHDKTRYAGHPYEVCRGGNSTHISLYVHRDDGGWWLSLQGASWGRSVETVRFFIALAEHGLPIFLHDGLELAAMLTGKDYIGIVPEGTIPIYCDSLFPDERFLTFMNVPWEETDQVVKAAIWYPPEERYLIN